jgi:hypothetical protein
MEDTDKIIVPINFGNAHWACGSRPLFCLLVCFVVLLVCWFVACVCLCVSLFACVVCSVGRSVGRSVVCCVPVVAYLLLGSFRCGCINIRDRTVEYWDSMAAGRNAVLDVLARCRTHTHARARTPYTVYAYLLTRMHTRARSRMLARTCTQHRGTSLAYTASAEQWLPFGVPPRSGRYIADEAKDKSQLQLDVSQWRREGPAGSPQQAGSPEPQSLRS